MSPRKSALPFDIYVRVSRRGPRADERFHSPEEQEGLARAFAKSRGLRVGVVLPPDIDKSGGTVEREGLQAALARVREGKSAGIVVAWIDRFSRDAAQAYDLLREFEAAGGRVMAPEAPEDVSTPEGELQLGMFLLVAQYQRKRARAGFERAKARATRAGIAVFKNVPVGYRKRADRTLEPDPATAPAVRAAFERRAAGAGWTEVARILEDATGRTWTLPGARGVIGNRLYATGRIEYDNVVADVECGALVDEPLWHAAQANAGPRPKRNGESPWLLTGLARCAACGNCLAVWTGARRRRKAGGWVDVPEHQRARRYRCRNRRCLEQANVEARRLERFVVLQSFAAGDELETRGSAPDLAALEGALATAEQRVAQIMADGAADDLGELWAPEVRRRREARNAAAAALGAARAEAGVPVRELHLRDVWDELSTADRRAALALFWREVRVGRKERAKSQGPVPLTFVARGPGREAEVTL